MRRIGVGIGLDLDVAHRHRVRGIGIEQEGNAMCGGRLQDVVEIPRLRGQRMEQHEDLELAFELADHIQDPIETREVAVLDDPKCQALVEVKDNRRPLRRATETARAGFARSTISHKAVERPRESGDAFDVVVEDQVLLRQHRQQRVRHLLTGR